MARSNPDTVLIVDAVDFDGPPGEARLLEPTSITAGGLSTHASSLQMVADYLKARAGARSLLLAIQPADVSPGEGLTEPVSRTMRRGSRGRVTIRTSSLA